MRRLSVLIASNIVMGWMICSSSNIQADISLNTVGNSQKCSVVAWIPYWNQEQAIDSFRSAVDYVDYISVFWYSLGQAGAIRKYTEAEVDKDLIDFAHRHNVKVFALVANLPDDELETGDSSWDPARVGRIIRSKDRRQKHIAALLELANRLDFDGINIDYEALPRGYRKDFSIFIRRLADELHDEDKLLAVALHPKAGELKPDENNGSHAQDWDSISAVADQVHLMTYGEHNKDTTPGPIASPQWIAPILNYAVNERQVPREKLFFGIPLYAEQWEQVRPGKYQGVDENFTFEDVQRIKANHQARESWDGNLSSPSLTYQNGSNDERIVWFENQDSIETKLVIGNKHGVCNIAFWHLGGEDPHMWNSLRNAGY